MHLLASIGILIAAATPGYAFQNRLPLKYTALLGENAMIYAVAADANGSAYVAGTAFSPLPTTPGAYQTQYNPGICPFPKNPQFTEPCPIAFAAKLSADGTTLAWLTYLGTSSSDGYGISVDAQGNAWITGGVSSTDLPVTPGALQSKPGTTFILELNSSGSKVLLASYFGGAGPTYSTSQVMDANGNLYLAGRTSSPDFPITAGALQADPGVKFSGLNGPQAIFVSKFDPTGKLVYSTFFHGGSGSTTDVRSIAADAAGSAYLTGFHDGASLPVTAGAFQTTTAGPAAFAAKLDPSGAKLMYCTYLARNAPAYGAAVAVDSQGAAYITGGISPEAAHEYPVTPGAFQTTPPDPSTPGFPSLGFVTKLNAAGSALVYSTFLYASTQVAPKEIAVDAAGSAIVMGTTRAYDFPTTAGALRQCYEPGPESASSGFLFQLAPDGSRPMYSTYFGVDNPVSLAVDQAGQIYVAGFGPGTLPMVPGSFGWTDSDGAFVAKLVPEALPPGSVSCVANAADRSAAAIAPGEIVDIFGNGIGPAQPVSASPSSGQIPLQLGGAQVLINGFPAPILSAGPNQVRAVVPFETLAPVLNIMNATPLTAEIQVLSGSAADQPISTALVPAVPAIFTMAGGTVGQALMINEDGTVNSARNPARQGSIATFYATGLNGYEPALGPGMIATTATPLAFAGQLGMGGTGGDLIYAGAAPGFVAGLTQINFRVPVSFVHGLASVWIFLPNGVASSSPVFYYLQ